MNADHTPGPWTAIGRGIFSGDLHLATTEQPAPREEYPDHGPTDPWHTSRPT